MKNSRIPALAAALIIGGMGALCQVSAQGQNTITNGMLPIVRIQAVDPGAAEPTNSGAFRITRDGGSVSNALPVFYLISGTASNGVDYAVIPNSVTIPAGEHSVQLLIAPIDDNLTEPTETVNLRLIYPPTNPPPIAYALASPLEAAVKIEDNDATNRPPEANIVVPQNNSTFVAPLNLNICANAYDGDGFVTNLEFFAGDLSLGSRTNIYIVANALGSCIIWSNVPPGEYNLKVKATDDDGASRVSPPVHIVVLPEYTQQLVTIRATDPGASEGPGPNTPGTTTNVNTGTFTVTRSHGTNALTVFYTIGGTASNGVDYVTIPGSVTLPAYALATTIVIRPIDDNLIENLENVILTLQEPACIAIFPPPPECYRVGEPRTAGVNIEDNDRSSNAPPVVRITTPTNGTTFTAPINIPIAAEASDPDDAVVRVEFFAGEHFVGSDIGSNKVSYGIVWSNALPGFYLLKAKAIDSRGALRWSEPVKVTVLGTNLPPLPTNLPPVVTIFASDSLAAEGTNSWRWYANTEPHAANIFGGTNTAAFTIRRSRPANTSLTLNYLVEGSASNGVDYVFLPGVVTIPPGESSAKILVTPLDDLIPECNESVIIRLLAVTNTPPPYGLAWPASAAALIVDNDQPQPGTGLLCDNLFHISLPGTNHCYRVEISGDMRNWLPVCTNAVTEPVLHFVDPESRNFTPRFYRAVPVPCPDQP